MWPAASRGGCVDRHNSRLFEANKKEGLPVTVEWPTTDKCPEIANVREGGEIPGNNTFWEAAAPCHPPDYGRRTARSREQNPEECQRCAVTQPRLLHPLNHMCLVDQWLRRRTLLSGGYFPLLSEQKHPSARYFGSS